MKLHLTQMQIRTLAELSSEAKTHRDDRRAEPQIVIETMKDLPSITVKIERPVDYRDEYVTPSGQWRIPKQAFRKYVIHPRGNSDSFN